MHTYIGSVQLIWTKLVYNYFVLRTMMMYYWYDVYTCAICALVQLFRCHEVTVSQQQAAGSRQQVAICLITIGCIYTSLSSVYHFNYYILIVCTV
jgi:hypothetical protein